MAFATRVSGPEFTELIRSKLKIFLSVDVVGSTALKQKGRVYDLPKDIPEHGPEFVNGDWLRFITNFYKDFPSKLIDAFESIKLQRERDSSGCECGQTHPPLLWKALGDELIFSAELKGVEDAAIHLESLARAINSSVKFWSEGSHSLPVSFKGTAWVAGFPVGNSEIPMNRTDSGNATSESGVGDDLFDYSGPAMDIGFRLARFSSPRRLMVSAELADLVISDSRLRDHFKAEPPTELKGVLRGRPYPLFWYDCYSDTQDVKEKALAIKEDEMLGRKSVGTSAAESYLQAWFTTIEDCYMAPFIVGLPAHESRIPGDYQQLLEKVSNQLQRIYKPTSDQATPFDSSEGDAKIEKLTELPPPGKP